MALKGSNGKSVIWKFIPNGKVCEKCGESIGTANSLRSAVAHMPRCPGEYDEAEQDLIKRVLSAYKAKKEKEAKRRVKLEDKHHVELRRLCSERGLGTTGSKQELIDRLKDDERENGVSAKHKNKVESMEIDMDDDNDSPDPKLLSADFNEAYPMNVGRFTLSVPTKGHSSSDGNNRNGSNANGRERRKIDKAKYGAQPQQDDYAVNGSTTTTTNINHNHKMDKYMAMDKNNMMNTYKNEKNKNCRYGRDKSRNSRDLRESAAEWDAKRKGKRRGRSRSPHSSRSSRSRSSKHSKSRSRKRFVTILRSSKHSNPIIINADSVSKWDSNANSIRMELSGSGSGSGSGTDSGSDDDYMPRRGGDYTGGHRHHRHQPRHRRDERYRSRDPEHDRARDGDRKRRRRKYHEMSESERSDLEYGRSRASDHDSDPADDAYDDRRRGGNGRKLERDCRGTSEERSDTGISSISSASQEVNHKGKGKFAINGGRICEDLMKMSDDNDDK